MRTTTDAGYDFVAGGDPYSDGVVAQPDHEIVHVTLSRWVPWRAGFEAALRFLEDRQRPAQALCAMELRSPQVRTFEEFAEFNDGYRSALDANGLLIDGVNPLARTNVVPGVGRPDTTSLHAFSFTIEAQGTTPTFVTAGAGELRADALSRDAIVAPGDTSPEGMRAKARHVVATMGHRLHALGVGWEHATAVDVYTMEEPHDLVTTVVAPAVGPAFGRGVQWFPSLPPVAGLDYEMDVRGVRRSLDVELGDG